MLHELLFALFGQTGGHFTETADGIKVRKEILILHPSEVLILDKLCTLGTQYKLFETFIQKYDGLHLLQHGKVCGMYMKAFAGGLNMVLHPYRKDLLELEQEILADHHFSLVYFQYKLDKYYLLFPHLKNIVKQVTERDSHGCQILDFIHKHLPCGIPVVNEALNKILQTCHKPLCKQLISWMIHGLLNDPYKEFFIVKSEPKELTDLQKHTERDTYMSIHTLSHYELSPQFLPSYISTDSAMKILFVGSSVCLFGRHNSSHSSSNVSLFGDQERSFATSLHQLQDGHFSPLQLTNIVNQIHATTNESLWQIVVVEAQLLTHLRRIKDFYLLGRGELFCAFIDQASHLLDDQPGDFTEFEVNRVFQSIVSTTLGNTDPESENFYLTINTAGGSLPVAQARPQKIGWSCVGLSYQVKWPLNTVLTPPILERYNNVFRFLLSLRQVQQELQQCWMHLMRCQRNTVDKQASTIWELWTHMMFLINNIQYQMQIEVLESEFNQLVKTVEARKDFEEILLKHNTFLTSVTKSTFLTNKSVHLSLLEIMNSCRHFCSWVASLARDTPQEPAKLGTIIVSFRRQTLFLLKNILLVQPNLYMKFDYNKYLSMSGVQYFGGTQKL